jgi:hypothetical protein
VTIAAGFVCKEGVLLCADTEHTGWTSKFHDSKVDNFEIAGGKIAFALAGNSSFAWSAIQKCRTRLQGVKPENALDELDQVLEKEYRRHVLNNPNSANLGYELLIALGIPPKPVELYVTSETCVRRVSTFECVGIGRELASFIIRPTFTGLMPQRKALALAAYALVAVKESISGCGGMSVYLLLQSDGNVGIVTSDHEGVCENLESYSKTFDFSTRQLLMALADEDADDKDFERNLTEIFNQRILSVRHEWTKERQAREARFATANPHLKPEQVKIAFRQISMGMPPRLTEDAKA